MCNEEMLERTGLEEYSFSTPLVEFLIIKNIVASNN
jgi:hypothetical protein